MPVAMTSLEAGCSSLRVGRVPRVVVVPSFDDLPSLQIDDATLGELELFLNGAYWPQPRFILRADRQLAPGEHKSPA